MCILYFLHTGHLLIAYNLSDCDLCNKTSLASKAEHLKQSVIFEQYLSNS